MRFQDNYSNNYKKKKYFIFVLIVGLFVVFLNIFKINKFSFVGDTQYLDIQKLKILSLNLLKDQPIFWHDKYLFQEKVKSEFPQVKGISYKIVNSDTLEINIEAEDICCVISDVKEKSYVISKNGNVLRDYDGVNSSDIKIKSSMSLTLSESLDKNLTNLLYLIVIKNVKFDEVKENEFYLEKDFIYFYTSDSKQVIINENTDLKNFSENLKSMKSYLQQNQKNYSILDFRFEKIVVK
jgi:cell division septal protein FtsQ